MSDIEEVKGLFTETQKTTAALRAKVEEMEGKSADYIDRDAMSKMQAALAAQLAERKSAEEALLARVAQVEVKAGRPGAAAAAMADGPEVKAFSDYLRKGSEGPELKAMASNQGTDGGYAVLPVMADGIQARLRLSSPVRMVANVVQVEGGPYNILVERGETGFEWANETTTSTETDTPTIDRISIPLNSLAAMPKVSQRMLDDAMFDVESFLGVQIADRFARAEATAFVAGNGVEKPKGFLAYKTAATADATRAAETLQYHVTGVSGAFAAAPDGGDALIKVFYKLHPQYQANASWMLNGNSMAAVATLKDQQGYLLRELLNADGSVIQTIKGKPAYQADDMPDIAANALAIAVGDFRRGYTIVDGAVMTVLRDNVTQKPHVLFYTTKRVGGGVSDFNAIKFVKFGTA